MSSSEYSDPLTSCVLRDSSSSYQNDVLEVYDGESTISPLLLADCGSQHPEPITGHTNVMLLHFRSGSHYWVPNQSGFKLHYSGVDVDVSYEGKLIDESLDLTK